MQTLRRGTRAPRPREPSESSAPLKSPVPSEAWTRGERRPTSGVTQGNSCPNSFDGCLRLLRESTLGHSGKRKQAAPPRPRSEAASSAPAPPPNVSRSLSSKRHPPLRSPAGRPHPRPAPTMPGARAQRHHHCPAAQDQPAQRASSTSRHVHQRRGGAAARLPGLGAPSDPTQGYLLSLHHNAGCWQKATGHPTSGVTERRRLCNVHCWKFNPNNF